MPSDAPEYAAGRALIEKQAREYDEQADGWEAQAALTTHNETAEYMRQLARDCRARAAALRATTRS